MLVTSLLALCMICLIWAAPTVAAEAEVDEPLAAAEAARTMVVPNGFQVTLFAGEPDVRQPIGFCIDDRGRLWVAEAYNYPHHGDRPGDRIVILEDADLDGRFDKRTVFYDQLNYVTGIEVGFGGAWVMSPPQLYFIPDRDGDDQPDGEPQVLLDGFGNHANSHNLANGFAWGPDGWLYGTHGRTNWSLLGKPGTPQEDRVRFDGGVYRYHPVRHIWEPFADGTTNPWGIDFDDYGQGFVCNCVNPHLFHVIQGAHYEPWRNRESSRFAYQRIATIADHLHFTGVNNVRDGLGSVEENEAGGGHAHSGTMVYLGDNWPDRYRNTVFMNNIHGRRINNDLLQRAGSGYIARHGPDLLRAKDPWYMGVTIQFGPDGAVYASDWSDTGECHSRKNTRRHTGRIFKITYGTPVSRRVDMARMSDAQLVKLHLHRNDWFVRHARRLLQERAAAGHDLSQSQLSLRRMFVEQHDVTRKLRALWSLHSIGALDDTFLIKQLEHSSEYVRAWSVRLLCEIDCPAQRALDRFQELAAKGSSSFVRLHLASALQRLPHAKRWPIATALLSRAEDADDANLPLMGWYAVEPLVDNDLKQFVALAATSRLPLVRRHIARRAASLPEDSSQECGQDGEQQSENSSAGLEALVLLLGESDDAQLQLDLLVGMAQGLEGRRSVPMPNDWPKAYARLQQSTNESVRERALELAVVFDDPIALGTLRDQLRNASASSKTRNRAIQLLVAKKADKLALLLLKLVADPMTQNAALRGLAEYEHPQTVATILEHYQTLSPAARQDAVHTLASRLSWAMRLMDAIESQQISRGDLTAYTVRQLHSLGNARLDVRIKQLWGNVRATSADKARLIAVYKQQLTDESLAKADLSAGRALFEKTCANCHRLFDAGKKVGPDITGSQRRNLDYILENMIDPNAAVSRDYRMQVVVTTGGRNITGLVIAEGERAVTIQTVNERLVVPLDEIEERSATSVSMMPEGQLQKLSAEQVRDLVAYLRSPTQVPLPIDE